MENTNCIICNNNKFNLYATFNIYNKKFTLVDCLECRFIYLNPRIKEIDISKFYGNNYQPFQNKISFTNILYSLFRKINFLFKYRIINKYVNEGKTLDIGSGDNFFSNSMKSKGWKSYSYDKFYNSISNTKSLSSLNSNSFKCITLWHSIEHMYDINDVFKNINNLLNDDGYLFIACPNLNSSEVEILNENWIAYDIPRHLYHFSFKTMDKFLRKHNIKIIDIQNLKMDTLYNVFMSNNINIFKKIYVYLRSMLIQFFDKKKSSTIIYVCKLK